MTATIRFPEAHAFRLPQIDRLAPGTVVAAILLYVAALFVLRLSLSPFLEIDEAQFMGAVDFRLVYDNSHPPLYNWLVRVALDLTGWRWALAVALVKAALLAATHLFIFDAARRLLGTGGGIVALAAAALLPQVSWMSAHTLAHSVLVMAAAAAVVNALVRIAVRPSAPAFALLGLAAGIGAIAKFNMALLLVPLAIAIATDPFMRERFHRTAALLAPLIGLVIATPAWIAAALDFADSTERMEKLYRHNVFEIVDLPVLGIDGVLMLTLAILAWGGVVLALIAAFGETPEHQGEIATSVRRVLWRTIGIGLVLTFVFVLGSDMSAVAERYLTPLLMPLPLLAALALSSWRWRGVLVVAGALAFVAVLFGMVGMVAFDKHRWARPYDAVGAAIAADAPDGRITVASPVPDLAANVTLALRRAGRQAVVEGDRLAEQGPLLVLLWLGHDPLPAGEWEAPGPLCPVATLTPDPKLLNLTGRTMPVTAAIYRRGTCPAG
ncbi:glycosyltransferase family 39 protein [Acuticoccus sp. M5D2P5]|uniref:glycosyltransferase family 39 protein n=1 Tax=Acuticoccus kalidii TaxID=2910977 RepID=UPI001F23CF26|nr:glycosyltransferase family 39 protein [Acuticoccus kalidii]MCF3932166.1 glycosyltransferase family 39 protein [Acuticoccus kalidii]